LFCRQHSDKTNHFCRNYSEVPHFSSAFTPPHFYSGVYTHGTYGETIGFLSLGLQFKTGLKQRGEKNQWRITTDYLDGVLADFSG